MKKDFSKEIAAALQGYADISSETLSKVIKDAGKDAVAELKKTSPKGNYKGGGKYARSWKFKVLKETGGKIKSVVYALSLIHI